MREIKFRAWDCKKKKMQYMFEVTKIVLSESDWEFAEHEENEKIIYGSDGSSLMQFTGLKDKNGKEIYEGDIVETVKVNNDRMDGFEGHIYLVEWKEGCNELKRLDKKDGLQEIERLHIVNTYKCLEVIGNKFENPELLKQRKAE